MKKQLLCGAAAGALAVAIGGTAFAADMPVKAPPPAVFNWSGFYCGGHVGYGEPDFKGTYFGGSATESFKQRPSGFLGGAQCGQRWQQNTFVYGYEADISFMNMKKTFIHNPAISDGAPGDSVTNKLSLLSSLRATLGVTLNPTTLLSVTGGLGYARARATIFDSDIPGTQTDTISKFGGVVGLAAEVALNNNWSTRLEGLYYIFEGGKTLGPLPGGTDFATDKLRDVLVVRLALNYKFGDPWGKGPVVAKY